MKKDESDILGVPPSMLKDLGRRAVITGAKAAESLTRKFYTAAARKGGILDTLSQFMGYGSTWGNEAPVKKSKIDLNRVKADDSYVPQFKPPAADQDKQTA